MLVYKWTEAGGGQVISQVLFIPVDGHPLPGSLCQKIEFDGKTGIKVFDGHEMPLAPAELDIVREHLKAYDIQR